MERRFQMEQADIIAVIEAIRRAVFSVPVGLTYDQSMGVLDAVQTEFDKLQAA